MVLNDVIEEYKYVYEILKNCNEYCETAEHLINDYQKTVAMAMSKYYFSSKSYTDKDDLTNALFASLDDMYNYVTILTTAYEFYSSIKILEKREFKNDALQKMIKTFTNNSDMAFVLCKELIATRNRALLERELLVSLISYLQNITKDYYTLINLYLQFKNAHTMLLEPLPEEIQDNPNYGTLNIQSLVSIHGITQISDSLVELSNYFENIIRLSNKQDVQKYYIRKIETGSLLTTFAASIPVVIATIKLIDFCYPKFMNWKQLHLASKEQQLKLSIQEIETAKKFLEINNDVENADELIETASTRLFRYFKINPKFKVNEKIYTSDTDIKLLQQNENISDFNNFSSSSESKNDSNE